MHDTTPQGYIFSELILVCILTPVLLDSGRPIDMEAVTPPEDGLCCSQNPREERQCTHGQLHREFLGLVRRKIGDGGL